MSDKTSGIWVTVDTLKLLRRIAFRLTEKGDGRRAANGDVVRVALIRLEAALAVEGEEEKVLAEVVSHRMA